MVVPKESEVKYSLLDEQFFYILIFLLKLIKWFGFYQPGQAKNLYIMEESPLYLNVKLV